MSAAEHTPGRRLYEYWRQCVSLPHAANNPSHWDHLTHHVRNAWEKTAAEATAKAAEGAKS